jgi:hypothetical protein
MRFSDKNTRRLVLLGVVGALVIGALALPALAQNATEETSESVSEPTSEATPSPDLRLEDGQSAFAEALAEELGLPVGQVTDAITAAHERLAEQWRTEQAAELRERLDEAVAAGQLTQEQADAIVAAIEAGVLPGGPRFGGHRLEFGDDGPGFGPHGMMKEPHMWRDIPDDGAM